MSKIKFLHKFDSENLAQIAERVESLIYLKVEQELILVRSCTNVLFFISFFVKFFGGVGGYDNDKKLNLKFMSLLRDVRVGWVVPLSALLINYSFKSSQIYFFVQYTHVMVLTNDGAPK